MSAPPSQLRFVLALHFHVPFGLGPKAYARAFKYRLAPTLAALRDTPGSTMALHVSGTLLRWLALHQPGATSCLKDLVEERRAELLAGGWAEPFLPALPVRDAVGQLELQSRVFMGRLGARAKGGWVSHGAWDPALVEIFSRANLGYVILPGEAMLASGKQIADTAGMWLTERGGKPIRVLPSDVTMQQAAGYVPVVDLLKLLQRRRATGVELVTLGMDAAELGARLPQRSFGPWIASLLKTLEAESHWLRVVRPSDAMARLKPRGRVYVPSWTPVDLAASCLGQSAERLLGDDPHYVRAGTWETLLSRYEQANRVHKRGWLASAEVERLRRKLSLGKGGLSDGARARSLEQATVALYRAQGSAVWFEGAEGGIYNAAIRNGFFSSLAECEGLVGKNNGDAGRVRTLRLDYDRDGEDEILVRTPHFLAIVDPNDGGTISELSSFIVPGNVLDATVRIDEPWHQELDAYTKLPSLVVEEEESGSFDFATMPMDGVISEPVALGDDTTSMSQLADALVIDRSSRGALSDHFLGPATTASNLARSAHEELGDFVGASYTLVKVEDSGPDGLHVVMTREGHVIDRGESRLVQIKKGLKFSRDRESIEVCYDLTNRFQTTIESRFGVGLTLALPGAGGSDHLLADGVEQLPLNQAGMLQNVGELRLDQGGGRVVVLRFSPETPCDVFHYPVRAVVRRDQKLIAERQGVCVVLSWPVQLWGEERRSVRFSLAVNARPPRPAR